MAQEKERTDLAKIKELVELMIANELVEVEIVNGDTKIHLKRPQPQPPAVTALPIVPQAPAPVPPAQAVPEKAEGQELADIKSPVVGTFYAAPSPDSAPYVQVGTEVDPDTVVCIVEAMKVMNEIKADVSGTIAKIMVADGQAIEYGQALFKVKPF